MATIRKTIHGTWQVQIRRKGYPTQTSTFDKKSEAEAWARDVEGDMDKGEFKDRRNAQNTTLYEVLQRYLEREAPKLKSTESVEFRIEAFKAHKIAKYSMTALTPTVIQAWIEERIREGVSGSTVNRELSVLRSAIKKGILSFELNIDNPVHAVHRPKEAPPRERRLFDGEEDRIITALEVVDRGEKGQFAGPQNTWMKPLVIFAIETAMRRGEILSLTWPHVNLKKRTAHLVDTKNGTSRTVPLTQRAAMLLEELPRSIDGKVFPITENALKLSFRRSLERARERYREQCKVEGSVADPRYLVDLHFHDLRHEGASRLAKIFMPHELAKICGWKDLKMVMRYYQANTEDLLEKIVTFESKSS
jgi:integrase